ncbi:MAG: methyltransferase domain-containing protein [Lachnospiraceae bacterium]|nr:methyltransferase domain-containing protein [Lachnospiraceae bacterium]
MSETIYYSTGEFMKLTHVTKKTLRYYNEHDILKPAMVTEKGNRLYTDKELAQMQQILLLKYLGFSLSDIREMTINNTDTKFMANSLNLQLKLVKDRIEQMQLVATAIENTTVALENNETVDWSQMRELVELTGMENSLKKQYQNASNISSRIDLHRLYSQNKQGWFPWVFEQCRIVPGMRILELGCGDGSFWLQNSDLIPEDCEIVLSDISRGMVRDARRTLQGKGNFKYKVCSCDEIPFENETFDLVVANHVLFYCQDVERACGEIARVMKPKGTFVCSAYGSAHMSEISQLVQGFDDRIILSAHKLYSHFGKENGGEMLRKFFAGVQWMEYEDALLVTDAEPLISYILSCHGNQNQIILERYKEFRNFVKKQVGDDGFPITKDAGVFICKKTNS